MKKVFVTLLFLVLAGLSGYAIYQTIQLDSKLASAQSDIKKSKEDIESLNNTINTLPFNAYSLTRFTYEPSSDKLFIPEFKLSVPYSDNAKSLLYSLRKPDDTESEDLEADLITDQLVPPQKTTTLNCVIVLRIKIEDKASPYNPSEETISYKLKDGRSLQVYYSTGSLEGNDECKKIYEDQNINPKDYAEAFKGVESY